jgi:hypothetical protein
MLPIIATGVLLVASAATVQAQDVSAVPACPSQQELEQTLGSGGRFVPDGCRQLSITSVQTGKGDVCVLDFRSGKDPGILDRLADAAVPTQWWVACDNLKAR